MKKNTVSTLLLIAFATIIFTSCQTPDQEKPGNETATPIQITNNQKIMHIQSTDFENKALIPDEFTCMGKDISPELQISEVPPHTASLALIMEDPDAPNGTWTHWVIWNIPPETSVIPRNVSTDFARQGLNSWPKKGYGGPCPPSGTHRYFFKLFALTKELDLPDNSGGEDLLKAMNGLVISQDQYMGIYRKKG